MTIELQRRKFLRFLGYSALTSQLPASLANRKITDSSITQVIQGIQPTNVDELVLATGLSYEILIKWRDPINKTERFGFNNDFIGLLQNDNESAILWVNHEYIHPLFIAGNLRTLEAVDAERREVGGSILRIKREGKQWKFIRNDKINKRIDATTLIPFTSNTSIKGSKVAEGTLANCGGGITPWNTFLSCEENYILFYQDIDPVTGQILPSRFKWERFYDNHPEHYGWVVEIDPQTHSAKKHIALGRFAHESATCIVSSNGNPVVYSGDDKNDECLYKFIADKPNSLESGTLYVADIIHGKWLALDWATSKTLQKHFKDQTEVCIYARHAARLLGATPLDRPEDIEINPVTGNIFVTITNNPLKANFHGEILKIKEHLGDYEALTFESETFLTGGEDGFSSPDNLLFDRKGNLWICSDISGKLMNMPPYIRFKNNGLYLVPATGPQAGKVIQVASAPNDAELTGLCFDSDQTTLFISVQHPGERTRDLNSPTSRWPDKNKLPSNAVVQISGPLLESITNN